MKGKKFVTTFAGIRWVRRAAVAHGITRPRSRLAFKMLKQVKVKGGRKGRLCVAPVYARQWALFLAA